MNKKDLFDMEDTISVTECTGMIQIPPQNDEERWSYYQTYRYYQTPLPPKSKKIRSK